MKQASREGQFRRSRRNFSDLEPKFGYARNLQEALDEHKALRPKLNSIKINRNKLPPDFFPRSESLRKKVSSNRPSLDHGVNYLRQPYRKASSQRDNVSPQKTSFFGFFEESAKLKKGSGNTLNIKRQFESRDEPKRQKIYIEQRNFTPMTGIHRNEILDMFPASYDQVISEAFKFSRKTKDYQISARKQYMYKHKEAEKLVQVEDPENAEKGEGLKEMINMSTSGGSEDMHNITFFNAKSTSFPPIYKNHGS